MKEYTAKNIAIGVFVATIVWILVTYLLKGSFDASDSLGLIVFILVFVLTSYFLQKRK